MDCSPPGSSVHGDSPGKNTGVGCHFLSPGELPDPGIEPASPALAELFTVAPPGKPFLEAAPKPQARGFSSEGDVWAVGGVAGERGCHWSSVGLQNVSRQVVVISTEQRAPGQGHHVGPWKFSHPTPDLPNQTFWGLCLFKPPCDSEAREV